jgi:glycosyltransferase involved in cell wall biosynthesis
MNISIVIPSFYPAVIYGGTIFSSLNHARVLVSMGHTVYVSTTNTNMKERLPVPTGEFIEIEKNLFVKYYNETIIDKLSMSLLFRVWKDIRKGDIVHIQSIFNTPVPVALFFAKWFNKPVLLSPHGVLGKWVMKKGFIFKKLWLSILVAPFVKGVCWHATSEQEKREILDHFPSATVYIISNPISLEEFKTPNYLSREDFLIKFANHRGNAQKILVSMGRLQKKKGFDILIKAFQKVRTKYPEAYLLIAGDDEGEKSNLLNLVHQNNLSDRFFFTGNLQGQDKVDFLANADLFILPSHNENFGMVYAEALASGTPVIASKETPWADVEKHQCGKWVSNTVMDIEQAMLEVLNANDVNIRVKAREYVKVFSFENVAVEFEKVINIMGKGNA